MSNSAHLKAYQQAIISRDAGFDGRFFVAVKTTGIYCRPIYPANTPKEENIEYFDYAHLAAKAGYRPCLRCHPDSAPDSPLWNGAVTAAINLVTQVTYKLGEQARDNHVYFPTADQMAQSDFSFLKMPAKRKQTLQDLAHYYIDTPDANTANTPDNWLAIKGIGPWTINYAKMRGLSDPDIYLGGDLGVKKMMATFKTPLKPQHCAPFRSYLTFQLWNKLS